MTTVDAPPAAVRAAPARGRLAQHAPLAVVFALAALVYVVLGRLQPVPLITPDEFTYGHLAQSLAHGDGFSWHGRNESFRAALYIYAIAPLWAGASMTVAYALAKALGAILLCTVAIPTWLVARRFIGEPRVAVVPVALVLIGSWMTTAASLATENLALPLAAACLAATVLAMRSNRSAYGLAAVGLALLATWARAQLLVLVAAVLLALVLDVALSADRRARVLVHRRALAALAVVMVAILSVAFVFGADALGTYNGLGHYRPSIGDVVTASAHQWLSLVVMSGILPVALAAAALAGAGRRDADMRALGIVAASATLVVVLQSGWFLAGINADWSIQRYIEYPVPLVFVLAVLGVWRGYVGPRALAIAGGAVAAMLLGLPGLRRVIEERAVYAMEHVVGASVVAVPLVALALTCLAVLAVRRLGAPRAALAVGALIAVPLAVQAAWGWRWQMDLARTWRSQYPSLTWIDEHGSGPVARIFIFANEPLFNTAEFFNRDVATVLTPPPPFRGQGINGGSCGWQADARGILQVEGGCLAGIKRIWNDDPVVRMSFYGGRTLARHPRLGQVIALGPGAPRLRSLLVLPCNTPTLKISRSGATFGMPRAVSCNGFLQATLFLDTSATLVLRLRGGTTGHRAVLDGRAWELPAGRTTTLSVPVGPGVSRTTIRSDWRTTAGAPTLVDAQLHLVGGSVGLL